MKKLLLLCVLLYANRTNAQAYLPMVVDGAFWYITHYFSDSGRTFGGYSKGYLIKGDTTINNRNYKKIYSNRVVKGYIREDTARKQVFLIHKAVTGINEEMTPPFVSYVGKCPLDTAEFKIFDFSRNVGDTLKECFTGGLLTLFSNVVTLQDSIEMYGRTRRRIGFGFGFSYTLVEGIGSQQGGIYPISINHQRWVTLSHYGIYPNWTIDSAATFRTNVQDVFLSEIVQIKPNPAQDFCHLEWLTPTTQNSLLVLYDFTGKAVLEKNIGAGYTELDIDTQNLPNGMYIYKLLIKGKGQATGKMMIAR